MTNILSAISELGKWAFFIIVLLMIASASGYPTKDSFHRTNNIEIRRTDSRPKRFINLLTLVPSFAPSFATFNPEHYTRSSQSNNQTQSQMTKKTVDTPKNTFNFQEEDNSFKTASRNEKIYQKWKLRNQKAVYHQNA